MKKLLLAFLFCFSLSGAKAQLFYAIDAFVGIVASWEEGGYEVRHTWIAGEPAYIHGLRGGWYINQKFTLGMSFNGAYTTVNDGFFLSQRKDVGLFYSTLYLEYNHQLQDKNLYLNPILHLGYGAGTVTGATVPGGTSASGMFLAEPGISIHTRLGFMALGIGASWRQAGAPRLLGVETFTLSGPCLSAYIKFGPYR